MTQVAQKAYETFNQQFEAVVHRVPGRTAFRLKTHQGYTTVSYREAYRQARGVALGLLALGLEPGSRIAILSENRPEWVVAYLGAYLSGMVAVPLDTQISPAEWHRLIEDSEAQVIFVSGLLKQKFEDAIPESSTLQQIVSLDAMPGTTDPRKDLAGWIDWALSLPNPPDLPASSSSDIVTIIYTSGTTGNPKGVPLTHSNIMSELQGIFRVIHMNEDDAMLCLLPLQHVLASIINVLVPLYKGGQVVFADTLKRAEILQALEEAGITVLATVPQFFYLFHNRIQEELGKKSPMMRRLFRGMLQLNRFSMRVLRINFGKIIFSKIHRSFGTRLRLFVSGGSAFDVKVAQDFHDMGFTILQGYGLTETTGASTVTPIKNNVVGSVGPAIPGVEVKIVSPDEFGIGEILIRGPVLMQGYYKNPDATNEAIRDGWFHTGDLGRIDSKGNLFITGRQKEVIVLPNGKNIYPDELEAHYSQCPYIQEIAVIGVYSKQERGERLHAIVVPNFDYLKSKKIANAREILRDEIAALSNRLAKYKRLMSYQIQADPLLRTTSRKIKRLELKRLVESGQLQSTENASAATESGAEDTALMESAIGQEILSCLRTTYHRDKPMTPNMNLELDLGFDSMERVELLASIEQLLHLQLPEDFGSEIFTIRDLITRVELQAGAAPRSGVSSRQNWNTILAASSLDEEESSLHVSGTIASFFKYLLLRFIYYFLFRTLLRIETRGIKHLPEKGPYLICPNHQSYLDAFVLVSTLPFHIFRRMFFVGYSFLFTSWHMKLAARLTNIVPVDPDAHLLRAMKAGALGLRKGLILCIFPEGGRSFDGKLQGFKKGAAILSRELSVPIVPSAIMGTHEVWPRDSLRIRPHKVTITFGELLSPGESKEVDPYLAETNRLHCVIAEMLQDHPS
jgi:long-chain acyl-CoA synthetase